MKKIIIIPLLALGLIASQADTTEGPVKETNATNENKEVKESNLLKNVFEKVDLELYNEVIDNYSIFPEMSLEEAENTSLEGVKSGAYGYFYNGDIFEGIYVTY